MYIYRLFSVYILTAYTVHKKEQTIMMLNVCLSAINLINKPNIVVYCTIGRLKQ